MISRTGRSNKAKVYGDEQLPSNLLPVLWLYGHIAGFVVYNEDPEKILWMQLRRVFARNKLYYAEKNK